MTIFQNSGIWRVWKSWAGCKNPTYFIYLLLHSCCVPDPVTYSSSWFWLHYHVMIKTAAKHIKLTLTVVVMHLHLQTTCKSTSLCFNSTFSHVFYYYYCYFILNWYQQIIKVEVTVWQRLVYNCRYMHILTCWWTCSLQWEPRPVYHPCSVSMRGPERQRATQS